MTRFKKISPKNLMWICLIVIAVIGIISIIIYFSITQKPKKQTEIQTENISTNELQRNDIIKIIDKAWNENDSDDMPEFMKELEKKAFFEVASYKLTNDYYTVETIVTAPDLGEILSQINADDIPKTDNKEKLDQYMIEQLDKAKSKHTTCFVYIKGDKAIFSEEFFDAMCGGVYSYSKNELSNALQES